MEVIRSVAQSLALPVFNEVGFHRFSGHTCRATGAIHLASSGIDVWRIQLHGRWGSSAVLRYVRLSPLSSSMSTEAAIGKDLSVIQNKLKQAKAQLAQVQSGSSVSSATDEDVESLLGADLFVSAGVLGKPSVDDLLAHHKGWHRLPMEGEVLIVNEDTSSLHALRPPLANLLEEELSARLESLQDAQAKTWCGWAVSVKSKRQQAQSIALWSPTLASLGQLCPKCFGKPPLEGSHSSSSSSGSSASAE